MFDTILHHDTVTIFNRYPDENGDIWYATEINTAHVSTDRSASQNNVGESPSTTMNISVLMKDGEICGKTWVPQVKWLKLDKNSIPGTITAKSGEYFDMIILGEWSGADIVKDSDYTRGFYSYLKSEMDYVYSVTSVSGPYKYIPHITISAR